MQRHIHEVEVEVVRPCEIVMVLLVVVVPILRVRNDARGSGRARHALWVVSAPPNKGKLICIILNSETLGIPTRTQNSEFRLYIHVPGVATVSRAGSGVGAAFFGHSVGRFHRSASVGRTEVSPGPTEMRE